MKKFIFSYLVCLMFFSIFTSTLQFIINDPKNMEASWGSPWSMALLYIMYGSIPVLIGCLLGEFSYRKIKRSYKLNIGIPLFILLGFSYTYVMTIGLSGGYISYSIMDYIKSSLPITLSSLVFYFIRRIN
ncbi:hypothetical protein [Bacillus pseudomycoides]|uniref:hypothetical protein n=1 Tax=Bacillus pseudomycoides TaxID=64104 RepID=UPI000BED12FF|nr:hypothetical protein [Bacillus pseudomycoides]PED08580.1 hypothetical protein COO19_09190 [Bacillus pseudomycoides]PEI96786.1 hypothetical protein CN686_11670 [Bacillus pseudomycoides]PEK28548.1 hypothetical protein CN693_05800 [Bacillus pseudomycoides]PEM68428.1 hypothetical protein CN619_23790 [Bacillus pseudomycoides]PEO23865.1 hypothetical protein CN542_00045 [Bacillus pseudomycoides]